MKISVRKPDPKAYNASILSVDRYEKTIANAVHNVFINVCNELPTETLFSYFTWDLLQDLVTDVQAMYFVLSNWNKSFNTSKFTFPTTTTYTEEIQVQKSPEVKVIDKSRTVVSSDDEEDLLRTANNSVTIIAKNVEDVDSNMHNFLYDDVGSYKETYYMDLVVMIYNLQYVMDLLFILYDYERNDGGKFSLLMKLKSRANPLPEDTVPIFPKLPYLCYYDFWSWRQLHPLVLDLPPEISEKEYDLYQVALWLRIEGMQTDHMKTFKPEKYYTRYDSIGSGIFWKTGATTIYNNQEMYVVKGYWGGNAEDVMSDNFISFTGVMPIASPDFDFDYQFINGLLQIVYPIYITQAKGLIQTVEVVRTTNDRHTPGYYGDL